MSNQVGPVAVTKSLYWLALILLDLRLPNANSKMKLTALLMQL